MGWSRRGPAKLVWTGFKENDGKTEVLLQVTRGREPRVQEEPGRVKVVIPGCRLQRKLAGKSLDTRFFPGAVDAVAARQRGKNVEVDVRLRSDVAAASPERRKGPRGSALWVVSLPAPGSSPAPSPTADPGPATQVAERTRDVRRFSSSRRFGGRR